MSGPRESDGTVQVERVGTTVAVAVLLFLAAGSAATRAVAWADQTGPGDATQAIRERTVTTAFGEVRAGVAAQRLTRETSYTVYLKRSARKDRVRYTELTMPFGQALERLGEAVGQPVRWETHFAYIGDPKRLPAAPELPPAQAKQFANPVTLDFTDTSAGAIAGFLSKATGLKVGVHKSLADAKVDIFTGKIPLIDALRLMAAQLGGTLAATPTGVTIVPK